MYRSTIQNSIVIDLVENRQIMNDSGDLQMADGNYQIDEQKASRNKDIHRKPSQVNQKKLGKNNPNDSNNNISSNQDSKGGDNIMLNMQNDQMDDGGINSGSFPPIPELPQSDFGERDFLNLINKQEFSDVVLIVEGKRIFAHQVILASRSTFFETLFSNNFQETEEQVVNFNDSGLTYS